MSWQQLSQLRQMPLTKTLLVGELRAAAFHLLHGWVWRGSKCYLSGTPPYTWLVLLTQIRVLYLRLYLLRRCDRFALLSHICGQQGVNETASITSHKRVGWSCAGRHGNSSALCLTCIRKEACPSSCRKLPVKVQFLETERLLLSFICVLVNFRPQ
jgi:hypothetical protein